TLFGTLVNEETTRDEALSAGAALIADNPALAMAFPVEPDAIPEDPLEVAWSRVLDAADPMTGIVPADLWDDPALAAAAGEDAELGAIRDGAPIDLSPVEVDYEAMLAGVDRWIDRYSTQRIGGTWFEVDDPSRPAETREFALVRSLGQPPLDSGLNAGDIRLSYAEDPAGQYRLEMAREFLGDDQYRVRLRLLWPGTVDPMVETRDQWLVVASVDGRPLEVIDDDVDTDTYQLREPVSGDVLGSIAFDVTLIPGGIA
ncbi:MAG TPA: hypothetical protein VNZ55_04775, partial [Thermomicrobiales bacterium]|nr:hypothetical protein [Thermomicrobiales bacterium]